MNKNIAKKKVLVAIPTFPSISETFIERDVSKLIDLNNLDISIFSLNKGNGVTSQKVIEKTTYARLTILTCIKATISYILFHPLNILKIHNLILGKDYFPYLPNPLYLTSNERSKKSVLGSFTNARLIHFFKGIAYAKLIEKFNADEIHMHFLSDSSNIFMVSAMILGIPFSINAHAKDVLVDASLIQTKIKYSKFITVCNKSVYEYLLSMTPDEYKNKIHFIYHGIDEQKLFSGIRRDKNILSSDKIYIFMGGTRLVEKKGIEYMIKASKKLLDRGLNHEVHVIGAGPLYIPFLEKIKELGLENTFYIDGEGKGLPNHLVLPYYFKADIFILPAISTGTGDTDGIPNTIIEASFARLPIITTNAGSISELIQNDKTGIVISQKDVNSIVDAVLSIKSDKQKAKLLGENAYIKAKELFDASINVSKLQDLLFK